MNQFSHAEMTLMCIYYGNTRLELIANLRDMMRELTPAETELHDLTLSVLGKLEQMNDETYLSLELSLFPDDEMGG